MGYRYFSKIFFLQYVFQNSRQDLINVSPFIQQWKNCYVQLILYNHTIIPLLPPIISDIFSSSVPVALATPYFDPYVNKSCDEGNSTKNRRRSFGSNHTFSYHGHLCPYVTQNYMIRGMRCLAVLSLYPPEEVEDEVDIYWYMNQYWSRAEMQQFSWHTKGATESYALELDLKEYTFPPFSPAQIFIGILTSPEEFLDVHRRSRKSEHDSVSANDRTSMSFFYIPIVTVAPQWETETPEGVSCYIGISLANNLYVTEYAERVSILSGLNQTKVMKSVAEFKNSKISILIYSHFKDPPKPYDKIYYPSVNATQSEIITLIGRGFNSSRVIYASMDTKLLQLLGLLWQPSQWVVELSLKPFLQKNVGSDVLFVSVADVNRAAITCSGLQTKMGLYDYVQPFSWAVWLGLLCACVVPCIGYWFLPQYKQLQDILPFLLISIFMEASFSITAKKFKLSSFPPIFAVFIVTGVVVSNGYKGTVITSLVKPFDESGIESLEAAIDLGLTSVSEHYEFVAPFSLGCCNYPNDLDTAFKPLIDFLTEGIELHAPLMGTELVETCADYFTFHARVEMIDDIPQSTDARLTLYQNLAKAKSFEKFNESSIDTRKGQILMKLAKNTKPRRCNTTVKKEVDTCDGGMYIDSADLLSKYLYLDQFDPQRSLNQSLYILQDKTKVLRSTKWGITLHPLHIARPELQRRLAGFVEAGINDRLDELVKLNDSIQWMKELRESFGKLEDQTKIPKVLTLNTKIRVLFYIYAFCITLTLVSFLAEFVAHISRKEYGTARIILLVNPKKLELNQINTMYQYLK